MTPTKLLRTAKAPVAVAFTLASALLLGACGSAAGAAELETAQAQLAAAQAELDTLLYALQAAEPAEVSEDQGADPVDVLEAQAADSGSEENVEEVEMLAGDWFSINDRTDTWQDWILGVVRDEESVSQFSTNYNDHLVWANFGDEGVYVFFEDQFAIEHAEIRDDFTLVLYARSDSDTLPNSIWEVNYFEDGRFMNLFLRIEHLTIINVDTNNVMFSHQIHHGHPGMGVSSLAELRAYLGLD